MLGYTARVITLTLVSMRINSGSKAFEVKITGLSSVTVPSPSKILLLYRGNLQIAAIHWLTLCQQLAMMSHFL